MAISGALQTPNSHPITEPFAPVLNRILRRTDLSNGAKLTYGRLHQYAGRDGRAWPRISTLAREIGASERQTSRYLTELRQKGLIRTERRYYGGPNYYILTDLEPQVVHPAPAPGAPGQSPDPEPQVTPEKEPKPAVDGNHAISGRINDDKSGGTILIEENKKTTTTPTNLVPFPEREPVPAASLSSSDSLPADSIEETPGEIHPEKGIEKAAADPTPAADRPDRTTAIEEAAADRIPEKTEGFTSLGAILSKVLFPFGGKIPAPAADRPEAVITPEPVPMSETAAPVDIPAADQPAEPGTIEEAAADPTPAADALENTPPEPSPAEIAALIEMIPPHVIRTPSLEEMIGNMARRHGVERVERNIRYANTFSRTSYRGYLAMSITNDWAAPWDEEQKEILRRQVERSCMEADRMAALQRKRQEEEKRAADLDAEIKERLAEIMARLDLPELEAEFAGQLTGITWRQYQRRGLESTVVAMAFVEFVDRSEGL